MQRHLFGATVVALLLVLPTAAAAGRIDLTYTVMGTGGLSAPQADVSDSKFWWVDSTGTVPASAVTALGFEPFPAFTKVVDDFGRGGGGSLLLSSAFTVGAAEELTVSMDLLTGRSAWLSLSGATAPNIFALLLQDGLPPLVLANTTAELGSAYSQGDFTLPPDSPYFIPSSDTPFTPVSPGVTVTEVPNHPIGGPQTGPGVDVTLGALHWYHPNEPLTCGCALEVTSTYRPGAGTYQLLFGIYNYDGGGEPSIFADGALAVTDVRTERVPEPSSLILMSTGVVLGMIRRRHLHSNCNAGCLRSGATPRLTSLTRDARRRP